MVFGIPTVKSETLLWNIRVSQKNQDTIILYSSRRDPVLRYELRTEYHKGSLVLRHTAHRFLAIAEGDAVCRETSFKSLNNTSLRWEKCSRKCLAVINLKAHICGRNKKLPNHTFVMKRYLINTT